MTKKSRLLEKRKISECMVDILDVLQKHKMTSKQICVLATKLIHKFTYED